MNVDKIYSTILISILSSSIVFALVTVLFASPIASFIDYERNPEYIWIFGLIISIDAVCAIPFVKLRKENKAFRFASFKLANVVINVLLNLCFILLFPWLIKKGFELPVWLYNPEIGLGYIFYSNLAASIITFLMVSPLISFKGGFDGILLKKILAYSLPLLIAGFAGSINEALDRVLIKHLIPETQNPLGQLGIYGANFKLAILLVLFIQTFRFAAEPFFFNYEKEKDSKMVFAKILNYFTVIILIIFIATLANLDILKYFIGSKFWVGLYLVPILLFSNVFLGIYMYLSSWYKLAGKTMYGAYIVGIGAALTIAINLIFVPRFGIIAGAYGHFVSYFVMTVTCYLWGRKYYPIPYQIGRIIKYIFLATICVAAIKFIPISSMVLRLISFNAIMLIMAFILLKDVGLLQVFRTALQFRKNELK
ncbi:MAG: oligosaccharide flippase family protein [Bacteroidetes bacterium]|nr:oligosaccharide flippase family protein [Bacteroidota bacterium]